MMPMTAEQFARELTRTFVRACPVGNPPRVTADTDDKGDELTEFFLPHPTEPGLAVTLEICTSKGAVSTCTLRFGQAEISGALDPEDAVSAIEEILADNIVAIVRYKSRDAYDNRRPASSGTVQWLYQLPDDEAALLAMREKLATPSGVWEKLSGRMTGVFEIFRWSGIEIAAR